MIATRGVHWWMRTLWYERRYGYGVLSPLVPRRKSGRRESMKAGKPLMMLQALSALNEAFPDGLLPETIYHCLWPNPEKSPVNSAKGGPSGEECAANWFMGRIGAKWPGSVNRVSYLSEDRQRAGKWFITAIGRRVMRERGIPKLERAEKRQL